MTDALAVLQGRLPAQVAQVLSTRPSWLRPHLLIMAVRGLTGRMRMTMMPTIQDARDLWHNLAFYLGRRRSPPKLPVFKAICADFRRSEVPPVEALPPPAVDREIGRAALDMINGAIDPVGVARTIRPTLATADVRTGRNIA